ncbi:uncharacterized protein B0H18DRAFT_970213 [Fomitopsis serialis]|uniref:uncharacterized protein n=1 Tax=Fomitopsis serialis TaxID=139415 RepID=UPI002008A2A2|nr:uncharacterized protein B0H18DRAFT_970213 [Neoantrodia serialis]KAH9937361.1 hypothetical protein B0H18DRAFT_970213 [Neoantrodia serialis]
MAKPPKSSSSSPHPARPPRVSPTHHSPRRRASPSPSPAVLGLFATLASAITAVDGSPVSTPPPDFLCPHLAATPTPTQAPTTVPRVRNRRRAATPSTSTAQTTRSGPVADKYVSCDDGRWRKTDVWTLYGSTFCAGTVCSATATSTPTAVDDDDDAGETSATVTSKPAAITDMDVSNGDALPSGWNKSPYIRDDPLTPVIITLSVVLAVGICAFIVLCVVWRRKRSRRPKDPEGRARKKADDDDVGEELQRMRSQQRLFARASARWKANVRQAARRRRKHTPSATKDVDTRSLVDRPAHSSSISLRSSASHSSFSHSITDTTSSGRRDSYDHSSSAPHQTHYSPNRPPAYLPELSDSPTAPAGASPPVGSSRPPYSKAGFPNDGAHGPPAHGDDLPPADPFNAGHIATDDKAALARMASLASTPPSTSGSRSEEAEEPSTLFPLVPVLEDEFEPIPPELRITDCDHYEGIYSDMSGGRDAPSPGPSSLFPASGTQTPSYSREPSPHPPTLPAPPLRGRLAAPTFYEYPVSFEEDVLSAEPEAGPSAPPFDHGDSLAASAPPMELDYDPMDLDALPSAPPMGDLDGGLSPEVPDGDHWTASRLSFRPAPSFERSVSPLVPDPHASPPQYIP